jgi:glycosyltransferase involved in cell wall biosynthesis
MNAPPLISVIITCYNQDQYISEAIESVLRQTYTHWECFLVDDGSSDGSAEICKSYAAKDERIHYVFQKNSGVSAARNNGFSLSKGKYIQFLDGDDFLYLQKLERQVVILERQNEISVCYTNHYHYWQQSKQLANYDFELLDPYPLHHFLYGHDNGVSLPIHAALLRRKIWQSVELPFVEDYSYRYEDWIFWVRICVKQSRFYYLDECLVAYRMHGNNFVTDSETVAFNAIQATYYIANLLPENERRVFLDTKVSFILERLSRSVIESARNRNKLYQLRILLKKWLHIF